MLRISYYIIPVFLLVIFAFCIKNKTKAYDSFIVGAKDGIKTAVTILPYIMSMYVAVYVFQASGILDTLVFLKKMPPEFFFEGMFRPLSGYAAQGFMLKIFENYHPDSPIGISASLLLGSSDTTIYVYSLYFSSIGIRKTRYAYFVGLLTDLLCFILCLSFFYLYF